MRKTLVSAILLAFLVLPTITYAQIPLSWRDSGFDLMPGYRIGVTLSVKYERGLVRVSYGEATVQAGPFRAELIGIPAGFTTPFRFEFNVYLNNEQSYSEQIGIGGVFSQNEISKQIILDASCDGVVQVKIDGEVIGSFSINDPIDIMYNENEPEGHNDFASVRATRLYTYNCNSSPGTTQTVTGTPPPQDYSSLSGVSDMLSNAAGKALMVFLLGIAAIGLLIVYSQSKSRGWLK